jgi:hypothetical protein
MWQDPRGELDNFVKVSNTLQIESLVIAEWNMNDFEAIANYGSYRYRPFDSDSLYFRLPLNYNSLDEGNFYTDANKSVFTFADFVQDDDEPVLFESNDVNRSLYFDLEQCFEPFRPRSGINKVLYFENKYVDDVRSARRPRYYMASRYDTFKYWNSYRNQVIGSGSAATTEEVGVSVKTNPEGFTNDIGYFISDTAPFVVYEKAVPVNRIVVKMQTNLADSTSPENIRLLNDSVIVDPLQDRTSSSIPVRWKIEYLDENDNWVTGISFNENSTRRDGSPIVDWDGHVEVCYTIKFPDQYKDSFHLVDYIENIVKLPENPLMGEAYVVGGDENNAGELYIWDADIEDWIVQPAEYGFSFYEEDDTKRIGTAQSLVDPIYFRSSTNLIYREIIFIKGVRLSVETMTNSDTTFDLIELSPRLRADISNYVLNYSFTKMIANEDVGLPVGALVPTNGDVSFLNFDGAFTKNNTLKFLDDIESVNNPRVGSLIAEYLKPNIKIIFYEAILNVLGYDKFIPLKTMYSEQFPGFSGGLTDLTVPVKDLFFRFDSLKSPSMFFTNISLTSAVALLMDSVGFSNYLFKGFDEVQETDNFRTSIKDPVIPFFFVNPDTSVAQALLDLSISCQAAMYFDEYNQFVVMPKEYLLPKEGERQTNLVLYGQVNKENNQATSLPNIISINNFETKVLNEGTIQYNIRYIQKEVKKINQLEFFDADKIFGYKPVLLWEAGGNQDSRSKNEEDKQISGFALGAVPLNSSISDAVPVVENNRIINNIIDVGEAAFFLPRLQGYLFANGEIIRYDAVEYNVSGTGIVWIRSNQEYQRYFSKIPFNGKLYPTGNLRIFAEPFYIEYEGAEKTEDLPENVRFKNGEVKKHGRGQFGTEIVEQSAGLPPYWSDNNNVRGCRMESDFIFSTTPTERITYPSISSPEAAVGVNNSLAQKSTRNGIIKNFLRQEYPTDDVVKTLQATQTATLQSSAFIFEGPAKKDFPSGTSQRDFISYVYKNLDSAYRHAGTRMRIIGQLKNNDKIQSPINATTYFNVEARNANDDPNIDGGSGGIAIGVNPATNYGYYFEICAMTADNLQQYTESNRETGVTEKIIHNVIFYKIVPSGTRAIPYKLWGGISKIISDNGNFVGMDRIASEDKPTVYDLAVEYEDVGSTRKFYLYINNTPVAIVTDPSPLPKYSNIALFTRGSSRCMFENIYALTNVQARSTGDTVFNQIADAFSLQKINSSQAIRKYSMSGFIKSSYLTRISPQHSPDFKMYFEEFGTIMRECAYFNIRYDQAYPALIAQIAPTFGQDRGYTVSGFYGGSYGAEFLVFNNNDRFISLDETTGNYLRILGVTFTQNITTDLTVDDFFKDRSNFSDPFVVDNEITSPIIQKKIFEDIKKSRKKHGKREFSLSPLYIQSQDEAEEMMEWLIDKTFRERLILEIEVFGVPQIQTGDIVSIDYAMPEGVKFVDTNKQFVVYGINETKNAEDFSKILRIIEV